MHKDKKLNFFSFSKLFPNIVTISAICFGLSSFKYALEGKWNIAVIMILIAAFLDIVDGRLARFLKVTSNFGANLDSLADFVNFGIAPPVILYLWYFSGTDANTLGWMVVLCYVTGCAIRLARFNSDLSDKNNILFKEQFFKGVPSPMGAYLVIIPLMLDLEFEIKHLFLPEILAFYMVFVSVLMPSTIPTFSTKKIVIQRKYVPLFLISFAVILAITATKPWLILPALGVCYLVTIPLSISSFRKLSKNYGN